MNQFTIYQRVGWFQEPWVCEIEENGEEVEDGTTFLIPTTEIGYYNGFRPRRNVAEWCNTTYEKKKMANEIWSGWAFGVDYRPEVDSWKARFIFSTEADAHMFMLKWT